MAPTFAPTPVPTMGIVVADYKAVAADLNTDDEFGFSAHMSGPGDYIITGSYGAVPSNQGAAYVHIYNGTDWVQQAKLVPADANSNDFFAFDVASDYSGTRVIAGSHQWDGVGNNQGAAFVFTRSGSSWSEEAALTSSMGSAQDLFGYSVDMNGDGTRAVVSAHQEDPGSVTNAGAAYVFERNTMTNAWTEIQMLTTSPPMPGDEFGYTVAIDQAGTTIVVGGHQTDENGTDAGSVYVFVRDSMSGLWSQQQQLFCSDCVANDHFGATADISWNGEYIVAASERKSSNTGAAYVFKRTAGVWSEIAKVVPNDPQVGDMFGRGATLDGDGTRLLIGAAQNTGGPNAAGTAYLFDWSGVSYVQVAQLVASDPQSTARFGYSVALADDGAEAAVGCPRAEQASTPRAGYFSFA
jgi:hypothetical protein